MCILDHLARPEHFSEEENRRMKEAAERCKECHGSGKIGPKNYPIPCPYCHGEGKICKKCFGTGEMEKKHKCAYCGHEKVIKKPCPNKN